MSGLGGEGGSQGGAWGTVAEVGGDVLSSLVGAGEAYTNRHFQEEMSSTAHRREVTDLIQAGLNPVLAATGGGESTPQGAMFTPDNPAKGLVGNIMLNKMTQANVDKTNAEADLTREGINTQQTQQAVNSALAAKALADTKVSNKSLDAIGAAINRDYSQSTLNTAMQAKVAYDSGLSKIEYLASKPAASFLDWFNAGLDKVGQMVLQNVNSQQK